MEDSDYKPEPGDVTIESRDPQYGAGRDPARGGRIAVDDFKSSVKEFAARIPDQIGKAFESLQARAQAITIALSFAIEASSGGPNQS